MMESLYLLIPLSVVLVFLIGVAFWWSVRSGQFDDMEGPAYRILMDDDQPHPGGVASQHDVSETKKIDD
jgi:cbb3-type cytochrome oxidase maturation protein